MNTCYTADRNTWLVHYQGFYGDSFPRETRLKMFQALFGFAAILDVFTFKPLLDLCALF